MYFIIVIIIILTKRIEKSCIIFNNTKVGESNFISHKKKKKSVGLINFNIIISIVI